MFVRLIEKSVSVTLCVRTLFAVLNGLGRLGDGLVGLYTAATAANGRAAGRNGQINSLSDLVQLLHQELDVVEF